MARKQPPRLGDSGLSTKAVDKLVHESIASRRNRGATGTWLGLVKKAPSKKIQ